MAGAGEIRQLRRRISTVKNTQKITKAMEQIAASRVIRAQRAVAEAAPYARKLTEVMRGLAVSNEVRNHPMLNEHEQLERAAVVVITSDRGLAGAYNTNALKRCERTIAALEADGLEVELFGVGRKVQTYFRFRGREVTDLWTGVSDKPSYDDARAVSRAVVDRYVQQDFDRVVIVYTDFQSLINQVPTAMELLPVDPTSLEGGQEIPAEFVFEPSPDEILELLVPRYVEAKIFNAMLESSASEHASRQRAMKNATDNADDVITKLSRQMNAARQEQITTEISEIVGGAEALSES